MPSIQQVIAEIQLSADLPPHHIAKAIQIIRDAEQRLKLRGATGKPRKASGKGLVTLPEWESIHGKLSIVVMNDWMENHGLCPLTVSEMVSEFRGEMIAKGKQYANFKAAFITYLNKGYLSKKLDDCKKARSAHYYHTTMDNRGVTL